MQVDRCKPLSSASISSQGVLESMQAADSGNPFGSMQSVGINPNKGKSKSGSGKSKAKRPPYYSKNNSWNNNNGQGKV